MGLVMALGRRLGRLFKAATNVGAILYCLALFGLLLLYWSGHVRRWWLAFAINFLPFYFLPVLALLLAALLLRARTAIIAALPLALIGLVLYAPYYLPKSTAAASGTPLHLITFNVSDTNQHMDAVVAWLREQRADVVLLQEVSAEWFGPLDQALNDLYPNQVHQLTEIGQRGNLTLSRFPVVLVPSVPLDTFVFQPVILDVEGQPTAFYNVSLATPVDALPERDLPFEFPLVDYVFRYDEVNRNLQIDKLVSQIDRETPPFIVAGDFNMGDQATSYGKLAARMDDSFREAGTNLGLTWPAFQVIGLPQALPALLRIDYLWHSGGFRARSARVGPYLGSDHLPVDATLEMESPAAG